MSNARSATQRPTTDDDAEAVPVASPARPRLATDVSVEVRSTFSGRWVEGFAVAESGEGGYRLRRVSDRSMLPAWFPLDEVRVAGQH